MVEDLYVEKLNLFKQNERPEVVLILLDNPDLMKLIVAWMNLDVKRKDILTVLAEKSETELWKWLWQNTDYSFSELKDIIGTSISEVALENRIKPLIGNRIIYPDGTVNSFVQKYLREQVVKLFETKLKKSPSGA